MNAKPTTGCCVCLVTAASEEQAAEIASALVTEQLAACVNIVAKIRSIYRWQGKLCDDQETLLVIKTQTALFEPLRQRVREHHSYDCPEVICLPIEAGDPDYLQWLTKETTRP